MGPQPAQHHGQSPHLCRVSCRSSQDSCSPILTPRSSEVRAHHPSPRAADTSPVTHSRPHAHTSTTLLLPAAHKDPAWRGGPQIADAAAGNMVVTTQRQAPGQGLLHAGQKDRQTAGWNACGVGKILHALPTTLFQLPTHHGSLPSCYDTARPEAVYDSEGWGVDGEGKNGWSIGLRCH